MVFCDNNLEDGMEVGKEAQEGGIYVYLELTHIVVWQKPAQHCKAIILQLKKNLLSGTQLTSQSLLYHIFH